MSPCFEGQQRDGPGRNGSGDGDPEAVSNGADVSEVEGRRLIAAVRGLHDLRAPSGREGQKSGCEAEGGGHHQQAGEKLAGLAAGEVRSGGETGEDETDDEQDDGDGPFDGVEVVRRVAEDPFDLVPVGNAFVFEDFLGGQRNVAGSEQSGSRNVSLDPVVGEEPGGDEDGAFQSGEGDEQVAAGHVDLFGFVKVEGDDELIFRKLFETKVAQF